jgi:uncharacterized protein
MTSVADTGFVVALMNEHDQWRRPCIALYQQESKIYLPNSTLTEIAYLLGREGGNQHVANFLTQLPKMKFEVVALDELHLERSAELLRQYADSRVDYVDTTVVAVAEQLEITRILTLDHRDFHIIRPRHCDFFELLPQKS